MWLWLIAAMLRAQPPLAESPAALQREVDRLFSQRNGPSLACEAYKYPARLSYDFRYWSGIDFEIEMGQFLPLQEGERVWMLLRVTPQGRPARYFTQLRHLPSPKRIPPGTNLKKISLQLGGGVYLGEGSYRIEAMLIDDKERRCRRDWNVTAKPVAQPLRIDPLTAEGGRGRRPSPPLGEPKEHIAAVLTLDSLAPRRNAARLNGWELATLTGSLFSLMDSRPDAEFSLDVIHTESRRVLYSTARFDARSVEPVMRALRDLDLGTIDFQGLQKGARANFFAEFVDQQREKWARRDAVVFLGPAWRWGEKLPETLRRKQEGLPRLAYLAFSPPFLPPEDVAKQFVAAQDGRVLRVSSPEDLARALKKLWLDNLVNRIPDHVADIGRNHAGARESAR